MKIESKNQDVNFYDSEQQSDSLLNDINYICGSNSIIRNALKDGFDVAQLPNGDIIVTEVRTVNVSYSWNANKNKMTKISMQ
ncbi:MAG: DUF2671 domain-containing protein [Rickettsiaceae bacterium]